jgi:hypothetical protein
MRFMIIRRADEDTEKGVMPSRELIEAMVAYNEELVKAGVMLAGEGLHPSSDGIRISFDGGTPTITDGPFAETKELIAGYTLIEVRSREEAIEWVKRWPAEDGRGRVQLELRQVVEADDFGEEFTPELREQEESQRRRLEGEA